MISNPREGQEVRVWYGKRYLPNPLHGKTGKVAIVSKGRPRNHGIEIEGRIVVIPAGNLRKVE